MQVLIDEREYRLIRRIANRNNVTVAEWVRQTLRAACRGGPSGDPDRKIARVRAAARLSFPTAEIDRMLAEIESGYLRDEGP